MAREREREREKREMRKLIIIINIYIYILLILSYLISLTQMRNEKVEHFEQDLFHLTILYIGYE